MDVGVTSWTNSWAALVRANPKPMAYHAAGPGRAILRERARRVHSQQVSSFNIRRRSPSSTNIALSLIWTRTKSDPEARRGMSVQGFASTSAPPAQRLHAGSAAMTILCGLRVHGRSLRDRNAQGDRTPNPLSANPIQSGLRISSPYHAKQSRTWFDARGFSIPATMLWQ